MLARDPSLVPGYDGLLLHLAVDLTDRLLPAFDTPSGLPTLFVNLRTGRLASDTAPSCTACAGTLLLEFGLLSNLTGNPVYMKHAHHCAKVRLHSCLDHSFLHSISLQSAGSRVVLALLHSQNFVCSPATCVLVLRLPNCFSS